MFFIWPVFVSVFGAKSVWRKVSIGFRFPKLHCGFFEATAAVIDFEFIRLLISVMTKCTKLI